MTSVPSYVRHRQHCLDYLVDLTPEHRKHIVSTNKDLATRLLRSTSYNLRTGKNNNFVGECTTTSRPILG